MQIKKTKLQRNGSKKTYLNIPSDWLIQLGIDISIDSMDKLDLILDEENKTITIKKEC